MEATTKKRMSKALWERMSEQLERKKGQVKSVRYLTGSGGDKIVAYKLILK